MEPRIVTNGIPGPKGREMFQRRLSAIPGGVSSKLQTIAVRAEGAVIEDIRRQPFDRFYKRNGRYEHRIQPPRSNKSRPRAA